MPLSMLFLTVSGLLWGTGGILGDLLGKVAGLSPLAVAAVRLLTGGALIVAFLIATGKRRPAGRAAWTRIAVTGVLSALFQGCYFAAIAVTSVSLATLVTIGGTPVIVAVVERVTRRRALGRSGVLTMVLALSGLGLLVGFPGGGLSQAAVLAGTGLSLVSAAGFAAVTLLGGLPVAGLGDLAVNGYGFLLGGVMLVPLAAVAGGGFSLRPGLGALGLLTAAGLLLALALAPTAVAYVMYYRGLRTAPASTAALVTLLEPLTAAILAAIVLGDRLSATGIAGAVVLLAAVVRAARSTTLTTTAASYGREPVSGLSYQEQAPSSFQAPDAPPGTSS
ncbi:MAG TPA: DMT family transporter [Streptosporangiaceae bacterium]